MVVFNYKRFNRKMSAVGGCGNCAMNVGSKYSTTAVPVTLQNRWMRIFNSAFPAAGKNHDLRANAINKSLRAL
jgi:hypothetical protein